METLQTKHDKILKGRNSYVKNSVQWCIVNAKLWEVHIKLANESIKTLT